MAERRPPGFNVDLGFYDSEEVLSIPRRIRAAAIGVWTLCGSYSANKLGDGIVPAEALRDRGCTPMIRDALMATTPEPLWEDAGNGAIRFTRWAKWQRTSEEIKAYRDGEAERKRKSREARKAHVVATYGSRDDHVATTWSPRGDYVASDINAARTSRNGTEPPLTSSDSKVSGRTSAGLPPAVRPEDGNPRARTKTETETETKEQEPPYPRDIEPPAAQPRLTRTNNGAELARVRFAGIPARSAMAFEIAEAFSASLPVPIEAGLLSGIGVQIDKCVKRGIPPPAIAAGLKAWTDSDSWSPTQIPNFVHKANNRSRNGKPTDKALGYDAALSELLQEVTTL